MKKTASLAGICVGLSLLVAPAFADEDHGGRGGRDEPRCKTVTGRAVWTLIPAPNDPLGRVLGPTNGDLKASVSAYLTSLTPPSAINPAFVATSVETWVIGAQDVIIFNGLATFTPIDGKPIGTVADALTLTVAGGTGAYAGATGTIQVTGTGHNLFGPAAAPGNTFFEVSYRGSICRAN